MTPSSEFVPEDSLVVVLYGRRIGRLTHIGGRVGDIAFAYDDQYIAAGGPPLSVRLPIGTAPFPPRRAMPFLDGLLPENADVRRRSSAQLGVPDSPYALLGAMGWDCPGAVQITTPDRIDELRSRDRGIRSVTRREIGERLRELREQPASWSRPEEHWSLAGQQEKFALVRTAEGWAEADGAEPTTHILKPGIQRLHHQALTEHATMRAAAAVGVQVAASTYDDFDGQPAIVVERFDRTTLSADGEGRRTVRIHQEDLCQATGRMSDRKYEANGGPTAKEIGAVLYNNARHPEPEVARVADFLLINYVAGAPDGHSKNVSIRILPDSDVRLAPLYDLATGFAHESSEVDVALALSIGGQRRVDRIGAGQWSRAARELRLSEDWLRDRARQLLDEFPDAFADVLQKIGTPEADEVRARSLGRLADHVDRARKSLER